MRVLVSVSSRHGGTRELGEVVADELRNAGLEVEETEPDEVERVDGYDAVVLGSSVYVGRLSLALRDLVERQGSQLRDVPVWLFWSGPVNEHPDRAPVPDDVTAVAAQVQAQGVQVFGGRLIDHGLSVNEKALVALQHATPGDYRSLELARSWARTVAAELGVRRR